MTIDYYNNEELAYATRKRYKTIPSSFVPFNTETQRSINLGDGSSTSIKTGRSNICNYVVMTDDAGNVTRWYVASYTYINGGQVTLNLQRDVVGEFGINECFGQIERGIPYSNNSIFSKRKELKLNQVLKNRKYLKPNSNDYGNFSIFDYNETSTPHNHDNEKWGILYFTKPSSGSEYVIPIDGFTPSYNSSLSGLDNLSSVSSVEPFMLFSKRINLFEHGSSVGKGFFVQIELGYSSDYSGIVISGTNVVSLGGMSYADNTITVTVESTFYNNYPEETALQCFKKFVENYVNQTVGYGGYIPLDLSNLELETLNYDNQVVLENGTFFRYTSTSNERYEYGTLVLEDLNSSFDNWLRDTYKSCVVNNLVCNFITGLPYRSDFGSSDVYNRVKFIDKTYTKTELTPEESGSLTITSSQTLVDEPYNILVFPLFDCTIRQNSQSSTSYSIVQEKAFNVFNNVIRYLSGENAYLVDAQIYPYCPSLNAVQTSIKGYPFFSIHSTTYEHNCPVQLFPNSNIKKEYIEREYSIVSPEQSGKFTFNFYDYVNTIVEDEDDSSINNQYINIKVKTALKPFAIISSSVITPEQNSIIGITYPSDLRGSQPSSNGFECSLSSDAFETYKRQNSTYQQVFALEKEELKIQHQVEAVNETTSAIVNTVSATAMGTLAGAEIAGAWGKIVPVGGGIGGGVAGSTVAVAEAIQIAQNTKLRQYEESLQQQRYDLNIQTIKNLPNTINRISSFNEIIMRDFWFVVETYECTEEEKTFVDRFLEKFSYGIGIFDLFTNFSRDGCFVRGNLVSSNLITTLHNVMSNELKGGIYIYE